MNAINLIEQAHAGDKESRDLLILENTGLIWSIVKRFMNRGYEGEELFQIGCIGLIKAVDNFNTQYNVQFSTYAVPMIAGEIKRFLRDDGLIKVSRSLKELSYNIYLVNEELKNKLGRDATITELSESLNVSKEEISMAIESSREVESLYKPTFMGDENNDCLMDKIGETKSYEEDTINKLFVKEILENVSGEERKLIHMRYFMNLSQKQVGEKLGISQVQVSRLEKKILTKMKQLCCI